MVYDCPNCEGKGFTVKRMESGTFYSRCSKCNGQRVLSGDSRWEKVQKYLTPEILADFFRSVCLGVNGCEYCPLWRECSKMGKPHLPSQEDWVEWLNKPEKK